MSETNYAESIVQSLKTILSNKVNNQDLATVATSGSYNDLTDKPTAAAAVEESTVAGWGFTKNRGTITGITMNGSSKGTSGVVDLGTVLTSHQDISGKQDVISDLATIRSNASTGASLKTKVDGIEAGANNYTHPATHASSMITGLATVATSGNYNDLSNKPTIPTIPSDATTSASGLMSAADKTKLDGIASGANAYSHPSTHPASMITGLSTVATSGSYNDLSNKPTIPTIPGAATTSAAGLMSAADKTKLDGIATGANAYTHPASHAASMITGLATVATSGSYNDLSNKPTIPSTSGLVPKSGDRGSLTGYETIGSATTINDSSAESNQTGSNITVSNGSTGKSWTKIVRVTAAVTITLGSSWQWVGGEAPEVVAGGILVCCWCGNGGLANFVSPS